MTTHVILRRRRGICSWLVYLAASALACSRAAMPTPAPGPASPPPAASFAGIDLANYPGDAALRAWRRPSSPYYWIGYYLPAPCHHDTSWTGKRESLAATGWGTGVIYVGEQDWAHSSVVPAARAAQGSAQSPCSTTLLTSAQASLDAADAIARMGADGFPERSTIFLDVEAVTTVSAELAAYVRGWIDAVRADGRYRAGVYTAKANAQALHDVAATGDPDASFWISNSTNFSTSMRPADVGFDFARVWQGAFSVSQSFNGVGLIVDVNVASTPSPSAP
jgi:hypothetical protein